MLSMVKSAVAEAAAAAKHKENITVKIFAGIYSIKLSLYI
jgi:hypothetical protein